MKKLTFLSTFLLLVAAAIAQPSDSYYTSADGKSGDALRSALMDIIDGHTVVSYDNLKELYKYSDTKEYEGDTRNVIIDIYSEVHTRQEAHSVLLPTEIPAAATTENIPYQNHGSTKRHQCIAMRFICILHRAMSIHIAATMLLANAPKAPNAQQTA